MAKDTKYIVVLHDGDGKILKKNIKVVTKEELNETLDDALYGDQNVVCWFPVSYLKKKTIFLEMGVENWG